MRFFISQHVVRNTWEHMGVMAGAVKMLDVGGIWAGKTQLGRLKKT
jgi:hypothetical protein